MFSWAGSLDPTINVATWLVLHSTMWRRPTVHAVLGGRGLWHASRTALRAVLSVYNLRLLCHVR